MKTNKRELMEIEETWLYILRGLRRSFKTVKLYMEFMFASTQMLGRRAELSRHVKDQTLLLPSLDGALWQPGGLSISSVLAALF